MHIRVHVVSSSFLPPAVPAAAVIARDGTNESADVFYSEDAPESARDMCLQLIDHFRGGRRPLPN